MERLKYLSDPDDPDNPQASVEASFQMSYSAVGGKRAGGTLPTQCVPN